ncbi:extracellular solute-binding protein [Paenibacillus sp. LjRoot153]|uniref:ABC transporter substrate-binding protein n=1 Tax=Paenibacillus sp. LjRoot153 TaxID=3342270 RepID=UPI003ECC3390
MRLLGKKGLTVLTTCSMALVFTACGGNTATTDSKPKDNQSTTSAQTAKAEKPITLKLATWEQPTNIAALTKVNEKFHAKYPNITITLDTSKPDAAYQTLLQTRLNANDADIITDFAINPKKDWHKGAAVPPLQQYIDAGLIEDLTGKPYLNNYFPEALKNATTYKDKVWGVDIGTVTYTGVFYNKELFEKNGLKVPTTWPEMMDISKKLKDSGVAPFTLAGKDVWPLGMVANGFIQAIEPNVEQLDKKLWSGETKFTDPVFSEIFTKYQQMLNYTEKDFMGIDYASVVGRFATGKAAMMPDGIWNSGAIEKANPNLKFGYFPMPASDKAENNKNFFGKYDMSLLVAAKSANKDAALKYLEFISQPDIYNEFINTVGFLPTQPNVKFTNPFMQEVAPLASSLKLAMDIIWQAPQGAGDYTGSPTPVQFLKPAGKETPEEIMQKMQKEWDVEMKNAK